MLIGIAIAIVLVIAIGIVITFARIANARTARIRNRMMRDYVRRTY